MLSLSLKAEFLHKSLASPARKDKLMFYLFFKAEFLHKTLASP